MDRESIRQNRRDLVGATRRPLHPAITACVTPHQMNRGFIRNRLFGAGAVT